MRTVAQEARGPVVPMVDRWEALHENAAQVATIADLSAEADNGPRDAFAELIATASAWQLNLARRGIDDIEACLNVGLKALLAVTARGQDASAPALTLWREFYHAREGVLALLRPEMADKAA